MENRPPEMLKPTLIAGASTGFVASIPVLGTVLICACCSPVIGCGFLAAYLYSRASRAAGFEFRAGTGATVGLISGAFFALTTTVVSGLLQLLMPQPDFEEVIQQVEEQGNAPPEFVDFLYSVSEFLESTGPFVLLLLGFFVWLIIAAVLSTIGGLIGGAVFKVEAAPPSDEAGQVPPTVST